MLSKMLSVSILALLNSFLITSIPQQISNDYSAYLIYGKITTHEGETYEGQIRWGKEEAFWFDHFNSSKPKNENLKWLSDEELDDLNEKDHHNRRSGWSSLKLFEWNNSYHDSDHTHVFACQFGDIKGIKVLRREKVVLELKNGEEIVLKGGSNDIGTEVKINDRDFGTIKIKWDNIEQVEFFSAPSNLGNRWGVPTYGTVYTNRGEYTGFVQWDHDERLSHDELNGETEDGELDIEFSKIKSIESKYRGSEVELNSGRSFRLRGSNDVNDENRGIIVNMPGSGRVDIEWEEFEKVVFSEAPANLDLGYRDFTGDKKLTGTVTDVLGEKYSGELVYDLDERYTLEMLDGIENHHEFLIPFGDVEKIKPLNREESMVQLRNGQEFIFEEKVDVTRDNDGILIFGKSGDPAYVPWHEVEEIVLDRSL